MVQTRSWSPRLERRLRDLVARGRLPQRQLHVHGGVLDVVVALRDLVGGERGPAPRAVGNDLVALIEPAVVPDPPQRPPDRLDVVVVQRDVGVVEVEPEADPLGQPVPVLHVAEDGLPAALVELGDPIGLDLGLRGDAQLPLDLQLDGQAVTVPPRLARDVVAGHGPVARIDVLEDTGEDVVRAGPAVGGRRALVEAPERGALAALQGAGKGVALAPALEHSLLELGEGLLRVDGSESRHPAILRAARRRPIAPSPAGSPRRRRRSSSGGCGRPPRDGRPGR